MIRCRLWIHTIHFVLTLRVAKSPWSMKALTSWSRSPSRHCLLFCWGCQPWTLPSVPSHARCSTNPLSLFLSTESLKHSVAHLFFTVPVPSGAWRCTWSRASPLRCPTRRSGRRPPPEVRKKICSCSCFPYMPGSGWENSLNLPPPFFLATPEVQGPTY